jgi:hypothetical protein
MKYICVQPRILYFAWQLQVMLNNFLSVGIPSDDIEILVATNPNDETFSQSNIEEFERLEKLFPNIKFFYYNDTRVDMGYIPSVYFNIMKQHYQTFPELSKEVVFCHDCDILFTKPVDFSEMEKSLTWYFSDTVPYICSDYILSKGQDIYDKMCEIIGIDRSIPILNNNNSGGAQYIVKNITYEFWDKVEKDSISLYRYFESVEPLYQPKFENDYPIQKWTAGMWSFLWNSWLFGNDVIVDKRLDFCWAPDPIKNWEDVSIFHNAGVVDDSSGLFFKGKYTSYSPIGQKIDVNPGFCSFKYVEELNRCKELVY